LSDPVRFPLSAVVGHDRLKLALLLNSVDPGIGGVLLRGQKGSAKTTLARGLAGLLPGQAPFVELPVGSTEDRVVGSLDLRAALVEGRHRFSPGLLAAADRGVLYVDEVNLLPDHLVDVLLDVAASGVNRVEREGVSEVHASRFVLVGSMNPEEGELRPQLLDRFGLAVEVVSSTDPDERALAVSRRLAFEAAPEDFVAEWARDEESLRSRLAAARAALFSGLAPGLAPGLVRAVSALCASVGAEGLRADLVICRAAAALAAWEDREVAGPEEVRRVADLALAHRRRRSPLEEPGIDRSELDQALDQALGPSSAGDREGADPNGGDPGGDDPGGDDRNGEDAAGEDAAGEDAAGEDGRDGGRSGEAGDRNGGGPSGGGDPDGGGRRDSGRSEDAGRMRPPVAGGEPVPVVRLEAGRNRGGPVGGGRRTVAQGPRGRLVGTRVPGPDSTGPIAVGATVAAAAGRRAVDDPEGAPPGGPLPPARLPGGPLPPARLPGGPLPPARLPGGPLPPPRLPGGPLVVEADLREAVRHARTANLVVLVVDASGSMGVGRRMEAAKGAVLSLLVDAYQRRDRVALVTFGGDGATVALRPTGSVEVARARLAELPTGGRTPLAEGIATALAVAEGSSGAAGSLRPLMVVISDGRATAAQSGKDPVRAAAEAAGMVRRRGVAGVVIDVEEGTIRLGLARGLAEAMGARYLTVAELSAGALVGAVRGAVGCADRA